MNIKNVFSIQSLIGDWKRSESNIGKKKDYVTTLKNKLDTLPQDSKRCFDRQAELDAQLGGLNTKMSDLLTEKGNLENQIQENQAPETQLVHQPAQRQGSKSPSTPFGSWTWTSRPSSSKSGRSPGFGLTWTPSSRPSSRQKKTWPKSVESSVPTRVARTTCRRRSTRPIWRWTG